jgi:hypothetical protein
MKFKEWRDKLDARRKDWKFTWRSIWWFWWEYIWKFCVVCVVSSMGCYLFASLNDTLSTRDSIYGTWYWTVYGIMYFGTLLYVIYRILKAK